MLAGIVHGAWRPAALQLARELATRQCWAELDTLVREIGDERFTAEVEEMRREQDAETAHG